MVIFVCNISYGMKDEALRDLFNEYGDVSSYKIVRDKKSGRSRGYGFVEMGREDGLYAISSLNGTEVMGRKLKVKESQPK